MPYENLNVYNKVMDIMGQQEVYNFLKKHSTHWFTSKDVCNRIDMSLGSVTVSLKKMRENNEIFYKKIGIKQGNKKGYLYKFKK